MRDGFADRRRGRFQNHNPCNCLRAFASKYTEFQYKTPAGHGTAGSARRTVPATKRRPGGSCFGARHFVPSRRRRSRPPAREFQNHNRRLRAGKVPVQNPSSTPSRSGSFCSARWVAGRLRRPTQGTGAPQPLTSAPDPPKQRQTGQTPPGLPCATAITKPENPRDEQRFVSAANTTAARQRAPARLSPGLPRPPAPPGSLGATGAPDPHVSRPRCQVVAIPRALSANPPSRSPAAVLAPRITPAGLRQARPVPAG